MAKNTSRPAPAAAPLVAETQVNTHHKQDFVFGKNNYALMLGGLGLIVLGFVLMSLEKAEYGFGTLGLTVGPVLALAGFVMEIFAILSRRK
jgi:hypothetical protein